VNTYETKHSDIVRPACDGRCASIQPSQEVIQAILRRGTIPLLDTSLFTDDLKVEVVAFAEGMCQMHSGLNHLIDK